jgi:hypothetical protein
LGPALRATGNQHVPSPEEGKPRRDSVKHIIVASVLVVIVTVVAILGLNEGRTR